VFAVADGIGSYRAGGQAAAIAVDQLALFFQLPDAMFNGPATIEDLIYKANDAITRLRTAQKEYYGMGSTLTVLHVAEDNVHAIAYQAGDSMALIARQGRLLGITKPQKAEDEKLSNHLGIGGRLIIEKTKLDLEPGDSVLICSDGLHGYLPPAAILEGLAVSDNPNHCMDMLLGKALETSKDNITGIVIKVEG